jgi:two-component system OmpR family response regulator
MRVLLIEDERDLARAIAKSLTDAAFAVDIAEDGSEGLFQAQEAPYDAIVLDVMLPGRDGWSVLETLRSAGSAAPIIMLTARDAVPDRVRGLNLGADDYLTKPFDITELIARLRALGRRAGARGSTTLTLGDLVVDLTGRRVRRAGQEVELTGREFGILELLATRRGGIVTRTEIAERIYNDASEVMSNAIDVHVAALRRKLGEGLIHTRRGLGYLIDV